MKKLLWRPLFAGFLLIAVSPLAAQSLKLESGTLEFLKGEKSLNVEYVYDGLTVGKLAEKDYIEKKVAEYNTKEAGTGDKWLASWKSSRTNRFEPKFEELINKQFTERKVALKAEKNPKAKFTLVLKTTNLEPGWNAAIMRSPAEISARAEFYDTSDRAKTLAVVTILKAPGRDAMGYDFDVGYRLQEGYAKSGKELGAFLCKKALK